MDNIETPRIDEIFSFTESRGDKWRHLLTISKKWAEGQSDVSEVECKYTQIKTAEILHAYPGKHLIKILDNYLTHGQKEAFASLVGKISFSIISGQYKHDSR